MKSARTVLWVLAPVLAAGAGSSAWSQDQSATRSLVAACFTCHGTDGRSVGGVPPALAGLDRQYLLQTMKDFKAGKRPATIMHQQAKGYTDQELEVIAGYFAGIKGGPAAPASRY
ncbi:MAG TPA: c-type cytochrome [Burkholderiales bacterium]|nr:c-type cytochrome [Burkholderiales bacterium]